MLGRQIHAYKGVIRKIFRNKELAEFSWSVAGVTMVAEFARMRQFCAFRFLRVKVVRHTDSDRSCGKVDKSADRWEFASK